MSFTVNFDEKVKGWTSFYSFIPDMSIGMNNEFYTFKGGELYLHHSDDVGRSNFYGEQYPSKISTMVNKSPSDVKEILAIKLEGNKSWNTFIKAYVTDNEDSTTSTIDSSEYVQKEGMWYAYARRNESELQVDSKATYGIGVVTEVTPTTIRVNGFSDILTVGDKLYNESLVFIGEVEDIIREGNTTTIQVNFDSVVNTNEFTIGAKDPRIEGGNLRGYVLRIDLETELDTKVELFAVNTEVIKSYS